MYLLWREWVIVLAYTDLAFIKCQYKGIAFLSKDGHHDRCITFFCYLVYVC